MFCKNIMSIGITIKTTYLCTKKFTVYKQVMYNKK